jgi:hypothetical protein
LQGRNNQPDNPLEVYKNNVRALCVCSDVTEEISADVVEVNIQHYQRCQCATGAMLEGLSEQRGR